jgi:hypothetical protein
MQKRKRRSRAPPAKKKKNEAPVLVTRLGWAHLTALPLALLFGLVLNELAFVEGGHLASRLSLNYGLQALVCIYLVQAPLNAVVHLVVLGLVFFRASERD